MKLVLSSDQDKNVQVEGSLAIMKPLERLRVAGKKFFLFLTLCLISVFIPIAHFFLVPFFLLIAFISFFSAYSQVYKLSIEKTYFCLSCKAKLVFPTKCSHEIRFHCAHCQAAHCLEL